MSTRKAKPPAALPLNPPMAGVLRTNTGPAAAGNGAHRRLSNWPGLLARFIAERRGAPFEWGKNDCCLFVCDGILALTGLDLAAKLYRGKYHDALGAARLLKKHGGVEAVAVKQFAKAGFPECPVALAQRGDAVLLDAPEHGATMGICEGERSWFTSPSGLVAVPTMNCRRAWAVGRTF